MSTTTFNFSEAKLKGKKSGKCTTCGLHRTRSKTFWQPLNPYNKTKDGKVKTQHGILKELRVERAEWEKEPIDCCELKY